MKDMEMKEQMDLNIDDKRLKKRVKYYREQVAEANEYRYKKLGKSGRKALQDQIEKRTKDFERMFKG